MIEYYSTQAKQQSGQDVYRALKSLTEQTAHFKDQIDCVNDIDVEVDSLRQSVNHLDDDVQAINTKIDELRKDIAIATKEILNTRSENFKVKQMVEHMDAQLEQERELRRKCEADEQQRFKSTMKTLDALIACFAKEEP